MADSNTRSGTNYITKDVLDYCEKVHGVNRFDDAFYSAEKEELPEIMLGRSEAKAMSLILRLIRPKKVLEIGTLAGYSALWIADALADDGKLWTLELEEQHAAVARKNVTQAGLGDKIEVIVGEALEVLPSLSDHGPFDAVFLDADKENYDKYGMWAANNLRPGGLLFGDNAFLFGELVDETEAARAMRRFHEDASRHFDTTTLPTPDGMLLGIKR